MNGWVFKDFSRYKTIPWATIVSKGWDKAKNKSAALAYRWPLATATIEAISLGYNLSKLKSDIKAGFVVSLIAFPLALALSIAVGLPPEHGIVTAVIAGIVTPIMGGSRLNVSGPTAAFVVILAPIISENGLSGMLFSTIMAGIILIIMGYSGLGRLINYIPYPVTTGFTAGIAIVLATLSLNDFLGLGADTSAPHYLEKLGAIASRIPYFKWHETAIGCATLVTMVFWPKVTRRIPPTIVAIVIAIILSELFRINGLETATIGSRFNVPEGADIFAKVFNPSSFISGIQGISDLQPLVMASFTIATLAAIESLLSASVADSMSGTRHNPNSELIGIGLGNLFSGIMGGISATGAVARTATNVRAGAASPFACVIHALFILIYIFILPDLVKMLPMALLAGFLMNIAIHMVHVGQIRSIIRHGERLDSISLIACLLATTLIDMVAGVTIGIILASVLFMKQVADITSIEITGHTSDDEHSHHRRLPDGVMIFSINGPLFFGSAEKALDRASFIAEGVRAMIIDMLDVPMIDMTGAAALESVIEKLDTSGILVVLCCNKQVENKLQNSIKSGIYTKSQIVRNIDDAIICIESSI